jgi:RimJ/RimL family protein N-acetyltransferase
MKPFSLSAPPLLLDQPLPADETTITEYCQDPVFERFLTLPWPYRLGDAEYFVREYIPRGWEKGSELTWALRGDSGAFLGAIGLRLKRGDLGFWLGAPHRGKGLMPRAVRLVTDWVFSTGFAGLVQIRWECVAGNAASAAVARKTGFTFTGVGPSEVPARDGSHPESWHGVLRKGEGAEPKPGWPTP